MSKKRPITAPKSSGRILNFVENSVTAKSLLAENSERDERLGSSMNDFKVLRELGRGSYGVVFHVLSVKDSNEYVVKKILLKHMKEKKQKEAVKEVQILRRLNHPHIIKYYSSFMEKQALHIIMEYASGGDLAKAIKKRKERGEYYTEEEIWRISLELCSAVSYLHDLKIIHRDIKTLNIFLTQQEKTKLGDLGVSKFLNDSNAVQATRVGTPLYLAPEMVKHQPYNKKIDVWALGCVLYHACALESPFTGDNLITLGFNIVYRDPRPIPGFYSKRLWNFVSKFLVKEQMARPKISKLLAEMTGEEKEKEREKEKPFFRKSDTVAIYLKNELSHPAEEFKSAIFSPVDFSPNPKETLHEKKDSFRLLSPSRKSSLKSSLKSIEEDAFKPKPIEIKEVGSEIEIVEEEELHVSAVKEQKRPMTADILHKYRLRPFSSKVKVLGNSIPQKQIPTVNSDFRPKSAFPSYNLKSQAALTVKENKGSVNCMFKPSMLEVAILQMQNVVGEGNLNAGTYLRNNIELVSDNFFRFVSHSGHVSKSDYYRVDHNLKTENRKNPFFASRKKLDYAIAPSRPSTAVLKKKEEELPEFIPKKLTIHDLKQV